MTIGDIQRIRLGLSSVGSRVWHTNFKYEMSGIWLEDTVFGMSEFESNHVLFGDGTYELSDKTDLCLFSFYCLGLVWRQSKIWILWFPPLAFSLFSAAVFRLVHQKSCFSLQSLLWSAWSVFQHTISSYNLNTTTTFTTMKSSNYYLRSWLLLISFLLVGTISLVRSQSLSGTSNV